MLVLHVYFRSFHQITWKNSYLSYNITMIFLNLYQYKHDASQGTAAVHVHNADMVTYLLSTSTSISMMHGYARLCGACFAHWHAPLWDPFLLMFTLYSPCQSPELVNERSSFKWKRFLQLEGFFEFTVM
jgi:hypothetical protein